jgi:glycine hydroxymethyltransferase
MSLMISPITGFVPWDESPDPRAILRDLDPEVFGAIERERRRQAGGLELIASENYVDPAVLAAQGSALTNKYAEGYPGKRYYGGCEFVDQIELLAIERAKRLFGAEHVNVQPHAGSQANLAAYLAVLKPGDTVLAMALDHGGHLSHGYRLNASGQLYHFVHYGVRQSDERIDYDQIEQLALEHHPRLIVAGASAYPRIIDFPRLRAIADRAGAYLMVDMAHIAGLVAGGLHPSPVPYADIVTTTTHKTLRGPRAGLILCKAALAKDIDRAVFPGSQGGPLMHIIAAKAVAFGQALKPEFRVYQQQIVNNILALGHELTREGIRLVSGGTDTHLLLADLSPIGVTGKQAEKLLGDVGIHTNKNMIPFDKQPAMTASGIRLGSPACTTRGMREADFTQMGKWIGAVLRNPDDADLHRQIGRDVAVAAARFPVPA